MFFILFGFSRRWNYEHSLFPESDQLVFEGGKVMPRMTKECGPSQGQQMIRGLTKAAKQIAAEEKINRHQLKLFDKLKTENTKFKM
jgi:hypothetical protein